MQRFETVDVSTEHMRRHARAVNGASTSFADFYYRYVALGEGCNCAEQLLAKPAGLRLLASLVDALTRPARETQRTGDGTRPTVRVA